MIIKNLIRTPQKEPIFFFKLEITPIDRDISWNVFEFKESQSTEIKIVGKRS